VDTVSGISYPSVSAYDSSKNVFGRAGADGSLFPEVSFFRAPSRRCSHSSPMIASVAAWSMATTRSFLAGSSTSRIGLPWYFAARLPRVSVLRTWSSSMNSAVFS
jgi:hypothetical protein